MTNKQNLPKPLFLLIGVISFLVFCLPSCDQTPTKRTTTLPYTKPSGVITSPPTVEISLYPVPTTRTGIEPVAMPPDMTGRISEMLKVLPNTSDIFQGHVWFVDYAAWDETLGIKRNDYRNSEGHTTTESENLYIADLMLSSNYYSNDSTRIGWYPWLGWPPFISGMGTRRNSYADREIIKKIPLRTENIGYGPLDVERSIVALTANKDEHVYTEAIKGTFDVAAIDKAAQNYQDENRLASLSNYNGVNIYSWDANRDTDRMWNPPVFDFAGQGCTLAVQPHDIYSCVQAGVIDDMIGASQGTISSLADDPRFQELANNLEDMGTMSAVMVDDYLIPYRESGFTDKATLDKEALFREASLVAPLLGPYAVFASGLGVDEQGLFVSLVLVYDSEDMPEIDAQILKERLATGYNSNAVPWKKEVDSSEIWSDGKALCAKLRGNVTYYWDCFIYQEPLLVREE